MRKSQARGYLLEIVIAKLIQINGYDLIVDADGNEIISLNNGLNVKGRGGYHQFDTLGRFRITPPFIYPLRLFVEAKYYSSEKVGIDRVRMGVGVLQDVNSNYSTVEMKDEELTVERYNYCYAIFSTTGFSKPAQRYAIAHKIHLIDLSDTEYREFIDIIGQIVDELDHQLSGGIDSIPKESFKKFKEQFSSIIIDNEMDGDGDLYGTSELIERLKRFIDQKCMYLATINGPFVVPLLVDTRINESLIANPHQNVGITRELDTGELDDSTEWIIHLEDNDSRISFALPQLLQKYLLSDIFNMKNNAIDKIERTNKFVFIAYLDGVNPTLCTLSFDKVE